MRNYIYSYHKESERYAAYPKQSTEHFKTFANITVDSDGVIPQEKQSGSEKDHQENPSD